MEKIAIVTSEGGLSCAYSVGALLALVEKYHFTEPAFVIGSSGSTATLAYYVAKQYPSIKNIWENLLSTKKFLNRFRLFKIMDIDYLIDDIFGKQDKLDTQAVRNSAIKFYIGATEVNGQPIYFSNQGDVPILEALRASSAMPVIFGKRVKINDKYYIDGSWANNLEKNIQKARELGATKIIVINNRNTTLTTRLFLKTYQLFVNKGLRSAIQKYIADESYAPSGSDIILITPKTRLPTSTLDNNKNHIIKTMRMGYEDACSNSELRQIVDKSP